MAQTGIVFDDLSFLAEPEALYSAAEQIRFKVQNIKNRFDEIEKIVKATDMYWVGEAGDMYRKRYAEYKPDLEEAFNRLSEYVCDLQQIAEKYIESDNSAQEMAEILPSDIII